MSNSAPPLFLASFLITFLITLLLGIALLKLGHCKLNDKSTHPLGTTAPSAGHSEVTPLNTEE